MPRTSSSCMPQAGLVRMVRRRQHDTATTVAVESPLALHIAPARGIAAKFLRTNPVMSHAGIHRSGRLTGATLRRFVRTLKSYFPSEVRQALLRIERFSIHLAWSVRCAASRRSVMGDGDVVVCMTSHGSRIRRVHHAIESIARGTLRPTRMILWIDEELKGNPLPHGLRRLQRRGLEIGYCKDDIGPHMKYFPYVNSMSEHTRPLVTADDDMRYSKKWLNGLVEAHEENDSVISAHFSRRVKFAGDEFAPWVEWRYLDNSIPDHRNAVIGFCGAVYPPAFLNELKRRGDLFRNTTPRADDVWLTFVAVTSGFPVRQIHSIPTVPKPIPGEETLALRSTNLVSGIDSGGNDQQLAETFGDKPRLLFEQQASRVRRH